MILRDRAFLRSFGDAVFYAIAAAKCDDQAIAQRHARVSIISSSVSLECAANCCLAALEISGRLRGELDKLPVLAKFEMVSKLWDGKFDRGTSAVQQVQELIGIRNSYVHPKSKAIPMDVGSIDDAGEHYKVNFSLNGDPSPILKIDRSAMFWFAGDAKSALSAVVDFFNYFFVSAIEISPADVLGVLCPVAEFSKESRMVFHQEIFQTDVERLSEIGIENRFLRFDAIPGNTVAARGKPETD